MKKLFVLAFLIGSSICASASHLRCGYITVERSACSSRTVSITITVFTNTSSEVKFGEDGILNFGDGTSMVVPRVDNINRPDLGPNIGMASFTKVYTYAGLGSYLISYVEPNRNGGIINMSDSFYTTFYTETRIDLTRATCSMPIFLAPPVFSGSTGSNFSVSLGATATDDQLITYELVEPFRDRGLPVNGYVQPPNMQINKLSGLLTWLTDGVTPGEYNFAVIAYQWVKEGELYQQTGYIRIDFQVILYNNAPEKPTLSDNLDYEKFNRILVKPGEEKQIELSYENGNNNAAILEVFSDLNEESISFSTEDVGGSSGDVKTGLLTISPQASEVRENGYLITVRGRTTGIPPSVYDINYLVYTDEIVDLPLITGTEKDLAQIRIFPNPVQREVQVEVSRDGTSEVLLYTAQGVLVKVKKFEGKTSLVLSDLPPGVYICDVKRSNVSVQRIKLLKTE